MTTGYKTLTPLQLGHLLHALATRQIPWRAARVWLACAELVAIREAAQRVRRLRRDRRVVASDFQRPELETLTGLNSRTVGRALGVLRRIGWVEFKATAITLSELPMPEAGERIQELAGGRGLHRPIPVPRPVLRFLAAQESAALGRVMLGYVCRGLSIARVGGTLRDAGTVKASWLAETLGLSLRSVRYAQAELRALGWIGKDVGSKQWKLNRHGAWFRIRLDWTPRAGHPVARPPAKNGPSVAPPKEDRKTPSESKNQKPGVHEPRVSSVPAPSLRHIRTADLLQADRLRVLHRQAVARGWVRECEADRLNFFAAAVRARSTPARDPVRVFVALVRQRRWHHVTQAQEEEARRMLCRPSPTERPKAGASGLGEILRSILPASVQARMAVPAPRQIAAKGG